jgi:hypothetical protein
VGDADSRHGKDGTEVECQAASARVITARRVDQQDVWGSWQGPDSSLEQLAFAQAQKAGLIRGSRDAFCDNLSFKARVGHDHG